MREEVEERDEETESEWGDVEDGKRLMWVGGSLWCRLVERRTGFYLFIFFSFSGPSSLRDEEDGTKEKEDMDQELRGLIVGCSSCSDGAEIFNGEKDAGIKKPSASQMEGEMLHVV